MIKNYFVALCLMFVTLNGVYAQGPSVPDVQLVGAEDVIDYGEMVNLKAVVDQNKLPAGLVDIQYNWTILEDGKIKKNIIMWPDGTQVFFAAGMRPKKFTIVLDVNCLFQTKGRIKAVGPDGKPLEGSQIMVEGIDKPVTDVVIDSHAISPNPIIKQIQIGNGPTPPPPGPGPSPGPEPIPPPNPNPGPTPDLPDGQYKISKFTYDLVIQKVPVEARKKAPDLANSYISVADKIRVSLSKLAAGVPLAATDLVPDAANIMKAIRTSNATVLGSSANDWQAWNKLYGDKVYELYNGKTLNKPSDWEILFRETATGLKAVK